MRQVTRDFFDSIRAEFEQQMPNSKALHSRACQYLPGGDTRTATFYLPFPGFMKSGEGQYMIDVDGHNLIDFQNNYTSLIHGHAYPSVVEAVSKQIALGSAYAAPFEKQVELADILCSRFPSLDLVRFTNSGTEANLHAVRAARAFTGRDKVVKTEGGYHGTIDIFEASVDPDLNEAGPLNNISVLPESKGVSKKALEDVIVVPFNDIENTKHIIEDNNDEIACVIIEPIMGSAGQITPDIEYLKFLREITEKFGIVLIFDEVVTGRLSLGGAQEEYGVVPDITTLGKMIGGGNPIGAFGGRKEIMDEYDPRKHLMYHSGTFNGNAISMTAGVATMEAYDEKAVKHVNELGSRFKTGMIDIYDRLNLKMQISGAGSIYNILFTDKPVHSYRDVAGSHEVLNKILFMQLYMRGVFNAERGMFAMTTTMTNDNIDYALVQIEDSLKEMLPVVSEEATELIL